MATLTPIKGEFRAFLNNGTSTTGAVKTVTVKYADLNPATMTSLTSEQLALLVAISTAATDVFSKSIYYDAITTSSQVNS